MGVAGRKEEEEYDTQEEDDDDNSEDEEEPRRRTRLRADKSRSASKVAKYRQGDRWISSAIW